MSRRWNESQLNAAQQAPCVPGFVACSISHIPTSTAHLWHTIYQAAFAQALGKLVEDARPTPYQRLVLEPGVN